MKISSVDTSFFVPHLRIIPREQHVISRKHISAGALRVLYRLHEAGFEAYLVGGAVRDLLLGGCPKDFDVATNATPEQIKALFRHCRLIGRRFRLAHVVFGQEIVEVATFRGSSDDGSGDRHIIDGRIVRDNVYGTLEEDAIRRDFTVNALYYNIADFSVRDYVNGFQDIEGRVLRLIGEPELRYREDSVRMLRAIRLAAKLDFSIESATAAPFAKLGDLLEHAPPARLFDESLKMFLTGHALKTFHCLEQHDMLQHIFPLTAQALAGSNSALHRAIIEQCLDSTDTRVEMGKSVTPAFLFAGLLWPAVVERVQEVTHEKGDAMVAWRQAADWALDQQTRHVAIPRRFSIVMHEIWALQPRFEQRVRKKAFRLLTHPRFRAAYDFLLLRRTESPFLSELSQWWTEAQTLPHHELAERIDVLNVPSTPAKGIHSKKKRRRQLKVVSDIASEKSVASTFFNEPEKVG